MLSDFWKWINKTPEEYAEGETEQSDGKSEEEFPQFQEMLNLAYEAIDNKVLDERALDDIITVMALDNESESVLDYIVDFSSDEQVERIAKAGVRHLQPEARWQIAELLYRRKPIGYFEYLTTLIKDKHPYVRQRASNCIDMISRLE